MNIASYNPLAIHISHKAIVDEVMSHAWDRVSLSVTDGTLDLCLEFKAFRAYTKGNPLARELFRSIERMSLQMHFFVRLDCESMRVHERNLANHLVVTLRPPVSNQEKEFKIDVELELCDRADKQSMAISFDPSSPNSTENGVWHDGERDNFVNGNCEEMIRDFFSKNFPEST